MAYKYLMSSGQSTTKLENYILDLFKLYLQINPSDIPGLPNLGFDFTLTDTMKSELQMEVEFRVNSLVKTIKDKFPGISLEVTTLDLLDETNVLLVLEINGQQSQDYYIDLYESLTNNTTTEE